jgi:hypothetical protein
MAGTVIISKVKELQAVVAFSAASDVFWMSLCSVPFWLLICLSVGSIEHQWIFLQRQPTTKLVNFVRRGILLINDQTTWDTKGTVLLQIFLQSIAQAGTFQDIPLKNIMKAAKDALERNNLVEIVWEIIICVIFQNKHKFYIKFLVLWNFKLGWCLIIEIQH